MEHKRLSLSLLDGHKQNYRSHPPEQIVHLKASLERFSQVRSIVVAPEPGGRYTILAGHGVVEAARECGITELNCDVVPAEWDAVTRNAYLVADNHINNGATDDETLLAELLNEQVNAGYDLASLGSDEETLRQMLASLDNDLLSNAHHQDDPGSDDDGSIDPDEIAIRCASGDLWLLGIHRLLVGDCTRPENVARLMQGKKAALIVTSPPYSDQREYGLGTFDWNALLCGAFDQIITHVEDDAHILINLGLSHKHRQVDLYWNDWLKYCAKRGWPLFGWYVWDQGSGLPGEWGGRQAPAHEFLFHFNNRRKYPNKWIETQEESRAYRAHRTALRREDGVVPEAASPDKYGQPYKIPDSVIRVNREAARGIHTANHPAVYPVALPEFVMKTWSNEGDVVYEPFCGSGTTIIAAENLGRCCYACEIDVKYASVILARWEAKTGKIAHLAENVKGEGVCITM